MTPRPAGGPASASRPPAKATLQGSGTASLVQSVELGGRLLPVDNVSDLSNGDTIQIGPVAQVPFERHQILALQTQRHAGDAADEYRIVIHGELTNGWPRGTPISNVQETSTHRELDKERLTSPGVWHKVFDELPQCYPAGATPTEKQDFVRAERLMTFLVQVAVAVLFIGAVVLPLSASVCCRWPLLVGNASAWTFFSMVVCCMLKGIAREKKLTLQSRMHMSQQVQPRQADPINVPRSEEPKASTLQLDSRTPWSKTATNSPAKAKMTPEYMPLVPTGWNQALEPEKTTPRALRKPAHWDTTLPKEGPVYYAEPVRILTPQMSTWKWIESKFRRQPTQKSKRSATAARSAGSTFAPKSQAAKLSQGSASNSPSIATAFQPAPAEEAVDPELPISSREGDAEPNFQQQQLPAPYRLNDEMLRAHQHGPEEQPFLQEPRPKIVRRGKVRCTRCGVLLMCVVVLVIVLLAVLPIPKVIEAVLHPHRHKVPAKTGGEEGGENRSRGGAWDGREVGEEGRGKEANGQRGEHAFGKAEAENAGQVEGEGKESSGRHARSGKTSISSGHHGRRPDAREPAKPSSTSAAAKKAIPQPATARRAKSAPSPSPGWRTGHWRACSKSCGSGVMFREVWCDDSGESECDMKHKPSDTEPCTDVSKCRWEAASWGNCSAKCGVGEQRRNFECANGEQKFCERSSAAQPVDVQECQSYGGCEWSVASWSECSTDCGTGKRYRVVECKNGDRKDCEYNEAPPPESEECHEVSGCWYVPGDWGACSSQCGKGTQKKILECKDGSSKDCREKYHGKDAYDQVNDTHVRLYRDCHEVGGCHWSTGSWGTCSESCGNGTRIRKVSCSNGELADCENAARNGALHHRPSEKVKCSNHSGCSWKSAEWSLCSSGCGYGKQTRNVTCSSGVHEDCASASSKPDTTRDCIANEACRWKVGEWSKCSTPCGEGEQRREAVCYDNITGVGAKADRCRRSNSSAGEEPGEEKRNCKGTECHVWQVGDWGNCSADCGEGHRQRAVHCPRDGKCKGSRPQATEHCSAHDDCGQKPALPLARPVANTTLKHTAKAGDTKLQVESTAGFDVGDIIMIGSEKNQIVGFASILLKAPLSKSWPPGTTIKKVQAAKCSCHADDAILPVAGALNATCGWAFAVVSLMYFVFAYKHQPVLTDRENQAWCGCKVCCVESLAAVQLLVLNAVSPVASFFVVVIAMLAAWLLGALGFASASQYFDGCEAGVPDVLVESGRLAAVVICFAALCKGMFAMASPPSVAPRAIWIIVGFGLFVMIPFCLATFGRALVMAHWEHFHPPSLGELGKEAETGFEKDLGTSAAVPTSGHALSWSCLANVVCVFVVLKRSLAPQQ